MLLKLNFGIPAHIRRYAGSAMISNPRKILVLFSDADFIDVRSEVA